MNNMKRIFILLLITTLWGVQDNISAQQLQKENNTPEVQGIIKDITGNPIIGATVIAKNQPGLGVTSDMDGKFKIKVGEYDILVISYIGYTTQEIPVIKIKNKKQKTFITKSCVPFVLYTGKLHFIVYKKRSNAKRHSCRKGWRNQRENRDILYECKRH